MKPGGIVVCGVRRREARAAIEEAVAQRGAEARWLGTQARYTTRGINLDGTELQLETSSFSGRLRTMLLGKHQARNAALAALAAETWLEGRPKGEIGSAIERGIAAARWPARAEVVREDPPVLVDGALFPDRSIAFVVALSRDKAHGEFLRRLGARASRFYLTEFEGERATPAASLLAAAPCGHLSCEAIPSIPDALDRAQAWARESHGVVVVAGSFFLLARALPHLGATVPHVI